MRLSEMIRAVGENNIQLTKSLGQNFLHDGNQLRRIVETAELTATDKVLEIGPGLGPLTELLLAQASEVLAIEKDRRLFDVLQRRLAGAKNLRLLCDDALDYLKREPCDWTEWKLVANLPYSVASPMLVELAQAAQSPQALVATLQLEVAQRIVSQANDEDYGLLALLVQLRYEPAGLFKIPAACFFPSPEVDSACVRLVRRPQALLAAAQEPVFVRLVKRAFSQRRKMMLKLLKQNWPAEALLAAFETLKLSPQIRAEAVRLDQFVALTKLLSP